MLRVDPPPPDLPMLPTLRDTLLRFRQVLVELMDTECAEEGPVEGGGKKVLEKGAQPTKAELEEPIRIEATPEELARAAVAPIRIVEESDD